MSGGVGAVGNKKSSEVAEELLGRATKEISRVRIPELAKPPLLFPTGHNQGRILAKVNAWSRIVLLRN